MKLTIKTLGQRSYTLELDEQSTVLQLKELLFDTTDLGIMPSQQKLIYDGRVLEDGNVLAEYNIEERRFMVVMGTKLPIPPPEPKSEVEAIKPSAVVATQQKPAEKKSTAKKGAAKVKAAAGAGAAAPSSSNNRPADDAASQPSCSTKVDSIDVLMEQIKPMGFPEADIRQALLASSNDVATAIEYLVEGNVPSASASAPAAAAAQPSALDFLRNNPRFKQIRSTIRGHPHLAEEALQLMETSNPQLVNLIRNNHDEFMALLHEPEANSERIEGGGVPTITLTQEDRECINRLVDMGFDMNKVIEAYMACDRNEAATAEFLCREFDED